MHETKPFTISRKAFTMAFERVKANRGTYGIDEQTIVEYETKLHSNLYKLWNRMSSGSYFPQPVRAIEIPKKSGGIRLLGIPTVEDRIAQMVVKLYLEPVVEPIFHEDSYGYRPNKSAIQALQITRTRCWRRDWVLTMDIKRLFDTIPHSILLKLVRKHTKKEWIILYIQRWLTVPFQKENGERIQRTAGTPQGGVISPVLANLFLHYAMDEWISKVFSSIPWARYADDAVAHCVSLKQAQYLQQRLQTRLHQYGLELNLPKTKIVYCKDEDRKGEFPIQSFDFLGYTFRPRGAKNKYGKYFVSFLPAMSETAKKAIRHEVKSWRLQLRVSKDIQDIAKIFNKRIQGWINYYSHFYRSAMYSVLRYINRALIKWVRRKYKKRNHRRRAEYWLGNIALRNRNLFSHWKLGILPTAG
jgi:RNA-directed DNA polymerase